MAPVSALAWSEATKTATQAVDGAGIEGVDGRRPRRRLPAPWRPGRWRQRSGAGGGPTGGKWPSWTRVPRSSRTAQLLGDPPVAEAEDLDRRGADGAAGGGPAHVASGVRGHPGVASHHLVPGGHHVLHLDPEVGEHRPQQRYDALDVLRAPGREGVAGVVADVVGGDDLVGHGQVAPAPQLLAPAVGRWPCALPLGCRPAGSARATARRSWWCLLGWWVHAGCRRRGRVRPPARTPARACGGGQQAQAQQAERGTGAEHLQVLLG